jgi:MarR family transcriptional regulator for hemolysin
MYIHLLMIPTSLEDNIVYLCAQFSHQFNLLLKLSFHQHDLPITPEQLSVLVYLFYKEEATQQEISRRLGRDETTITRVLAVMLKNKLVIQKVNPADKRSRMIALTAKGKRFQQEALAVSGELYTQVLQGVGPQEWQVAVSVLQKLRSNIGQLPQKIYSNQI